MRLSINGNPPLICTLDRDLAQADETVDAGHRPSAYEHAPARWRFAPAIAPGPPRMLALRKSRSHALAGSDLRPGQRRWRYSGPVAVNADGKRVPTLEKQYPSCFAAPSGSVQFTHPERQKLLAEAIEPTLQRELGHRGIAAMDKGYATELVGWVEVK